MTSEDSSGSPKRRLKLIRWLTVLVLLAIGGVFFLSAEHKKLIETCNFRKADPQEKLAACDVLLTWTAHEPSTRSLIHRHKMRVHMLQEDWDAALGEADLAAQADPESPVPWQWKALILARTKNFPDALNMIDQALTLDPGNDYSLETKAKLFRSQGRWGGLRQLVFEAVDNYSVGRWAWSYAGYFRLQDHEYRASALAFAQALRLEPNNTYDRRKFFEACRAAGSECPRMLADDYGAKEMPSCEDTGISVVELFPDWREIQSIEPEASAPQENIFTKHNVKFTIYLRYLDALSTIEDGRNASNLASKAIVLSRALDCISLQSDGSPKGRLEERVRSDLDRMFPEYVRQNQLQWAELVLTQNSGS